MKIAFTSDLHIPTTRVTAIRAMAEEMVAHNPDVVILGGDLGESVQSLSHFRTCLSIFSKKFPNIDVLVVPGNHDLWVNPPYGLPTGVKDSPELFFTHLPRITSETGCKWLESAIFTYGSIAITGSYLHYDYSAKDTVGIFSTMPNEYFRVNKGQVNADARYIHGIDDIPFATTLTDRLRSNLVELDNNPYITKIVIATHVPCIEEQITRNPWNYSWSAGTAYFGNLACDADIRQNSKITHVISGHSHQHVDQMVRQTLRAIVLNSDYRDPKFVCVDV